MPITIAGSTNARAGLMQSELAEFAFDFDGTHVQPGSFAGQMAMSLGEFVTDFDGQFAVPVGRDGAVSLTLGSFTSVFRSQSEWDTFSAPQFVNGTASNWDFSSYTPSGYDQFVLAPASVALPTGVTLNSAQKRLEFNGSGTVSDTSGVILRALDLEAEWSARSQASGVFYRHNMTYYDAAETQQIVDDATMRASSAFGATGGFGGGNAFTDNVLDTTNKLSGNGSWRCNLRAAVSGGWNVMGIDFGGIAASSKAVSKYQFYFQFAVYADSTWWNFYYGDGQTYGGKLCIIETWNSSFDNGEVVIRRTPMPGGTWDGYLKDASGFIDLLGLEWTSPAGINGELTVNSFYDAGSPTVTDLATLKQRHGVNNTDRSSSTFISTYENVPRLVENGWYVFTAYVDMTNDIVKVWGAPYGHPPQLVMGAMSANLPAAGTDDGGTNPQDLYTGAQLMTYPNTAANWPGTDTFVCFTEIIASDNPIEHPGGFSLPYPGTDSVPGYPPSGSAEFTP